MAIFDSDEKYPPTEKYDMPIAWRLVNFVMTTRNDDVSLSDFGVNDLADFRNQYDFALAVDASRILPSDT